MRFRNPHPNHAVVHNLGKLGGVISVAPGDTVDVSEAAAEYLKAWGSVLEPVVEVAEEPKFRPTMKKPEPAPVAEAPAKK